MTSKIFNMEKSYLIKTFLSDAFRVNFDVEDAVIRLTNKASDRFHCNTKKYLTIAMVKKSN